MKVEALHRYRPSAEWYTDEACYINELANRPEDPAVSIARARVAPDVCTRWHRLIGIVERYVLLSGLARIFHEGTRMIAQGFAPESRREKEEWSFHCDDEQRRVRRKEPARAA